MYLKIGEVFLKTGRLRDAGNHFAKALELDPENSSAYIGLSKVRFNRGKYKEAAEAAMASVGLLYCNPYGHYLLGKSLYQLGEAEQAEQALNVAVSQNPNFPKALNTLADIHFDLFSDISEGRRYLDLAESAQQNLSDLRNGNIPTDGADYRVFNPTTEDLAFLKRNKIGDAAYRILDADGDGLEDIEMITINGKQVLYQVKDSHFGE